MITSFQNQRIQTIRDLIANRRRREEEKCFVLEGVRLVEEAIKAGKYPKGVYYTNSLSLRGKSIIQEWRNQGVECEEISEELMQKISDTEQSQGILAVLPVTENPPHKTVDFIVILDAIQDPGNVGTIIRTSAAAGVHMLILAPGCADPYSPKVLRSAMGAHFHTSIHTFSWQEINHFFQNLHPDHQIFIADAHASGAFWDKDYSKPVALIIGSEAHGISAEARKISSDSVKIPMIEECDSLNAAVSAGILIYEVYRQRRTL